MELFKKCSNDQLLLIKSLLLDNYSGSIYSHRSGNEYVITGVCFISAFGDTYVGFEYSNVENPGITHTRPVHEFLDGRFKKVDK